MPTVLSDPSTSTYAILSVLAILYGVVAFRRQRKRDIGIAAVLLVVLVGLLLIDKFVESPREQVVRKIKEMGLASRSKKMPDLFQHVSESFRYRTMDKKGLQDRARLAESMGFAGFGESSLDRSQFESVGELVRQRFMVKHMGTPEILLQVVADFKMDADGEWRLVSFKLYDPINSNDEKEIPGL